MSLYAPCQEVDYRKAHEHCLSRAACQSTSPPGLTVPPLPRRGRWRPGLSDIGLVEGLSFSFLLCPLTLVWKLWPFDLDGAGCTLSLSRVTQPHSELTPVSALELLWREQICQGVEMG